MDAESDMVLLEYGSHPPVPADVRRTPACQTVEVGMIQTDA